MKMGRKREGDELLGPGRYIRLPHDLDAELFALAEEQDRPIGRIIRNVLREGLLSLGRLGPKRAPKKAANA